MTVIAGDGGAFLNADRAAAHLKLTLHVEAVLPGGPGHYGVIFMPGTFRRTKNDVARIVAALEAKLGQYPGEENLVNAEEWL